MSLINRLILFSAIVIFPSIYCQNENETVYGQVLWASEKFPGLIVKQNNFLPLDTIACHHPPKKILLLGHETDACVCVRIPGVYLIHFSANIRGQSKTPHIPVSVALYLNSKLQKASITTIVIHEPFSEGFLTGSAILEIPKDATIALGNPGKYPFIVQGLFVDDELYSPSINLTLTKLKDLTPEKDNGN